jgi:(S)-2-hydroxyglutarate dehydrogenase
MKFSGTTLHLFEKEDGPGKHQSGRNSGVLHCGLYYQPGSLKAKLAVEGIREMTEFCRTNEIAHEICGKVVVASNEKQIRTLNELAIRGQANGLQGLKFLSQSELKSREPHVIATEALLVPEEGIADYKAVMVMLVTLIQELGGHVHFSTPVWKLTDSGKGQIQVDTRNGSYEFDRIVSCTGLHSDRVGSGFIKKYYQNGSYTNMVKCGIFISPNKQVSKLVMRIMGV